VQLLHVRETSGDHITFDETLPGTQEPENVQNALVWKSVKYPQISPDTVSSTMTGRRQNSKPSYI